MRITWIGETTYSPAYGELRAGKLLEIPEDIANVWIGQGVAELTKEPDPAPVESIKVKKAAKADGGKK